jgi:hypothetical protein
MVWYRCQDLAVNAFGRIQSRLFLKRHGEPDGLIDA